MAGVLVPQVPDVGHIRAGPRSGCAAPPRPARGRAVKVLCPGIGLAIRSHLAVHGMTRAALAAKTGLSVPQIGRVSAGNGVIPEATFTALRRALATP